MVRLKKVQARRDWRNAKTRKDKSNKRTSSYPCSWRIILCFILLGGCYMHFFNLYYAHMKTITIDLLLGIHSQEQQQAVFIEEEIKTKVHINENNTISILSFSNGQYWCNQNAFWNAYYQILPPGIEMIELLFYETANEPSQTWLAWAEKYKYDFSGNGSTSSSNTHFTVQYRWYNGSEPNGSTLNPRLGEVRNQATKACHGYLVVNMDNDDIYHPHYISYALHHLQQNPTWLNLAMPCHASTLFNPDGTYSINYCDATKYDPRIGHDYPANAHFYSTYKSVFTDHGCCWSNNDATEERLFVACMKQKKLPIGEVNTVNTTTAAATGLGNAMLLVKTTSPLSITNQLWYVNRELYNRFSIDDTSNLISAMEKYYQDMHELQRPTGKAVEVDTSSTAAAAEASKAAAARSTTVSLPARSLGSWKDFHDRHPTYLSPKHYPLCEGFASMLGMRFLPRGDQNILKHNVTDSKSCCELCKRMSNATAALNQDVMFFGNTGSDAVYNNFCGAFTYNIESKTCLLGLGTIAYSPWLALTYETGIRIDPTCPKCGKQLDGVPLV